MRMATLELENEKLAAALERFLDDGTAMPPLPSSPLSQSTHPSQLVELSSGEGAEQVVSCASPRRVSTAEVLLSLLSFSPATMVTCNITTEKYLKGDCVRGFSCARR